MQVKKGSIKLKDKER